MGRRTLLSLAAVAAYLALCWWLMSHAADAPWAVAAIFGPWLLPLLGISWRQRQPLLAALALAGAALLLWIVSRGGLGDVRRLYLAQHALIHLAIGLSFATTLRPGAVPLITAMARRVHFDATPVEAYTRRLTATWAIYLVGMAVTSVTVFVWLPFSAWALLANVLTPVSALALFLGEYLLRYRLHPEFERISLRDMVRAAQSQPGSGVAARSTAGL